MRVCLDAAIGARWDTVVQRPAIRHLTDEQLARAIQHAERIKADPSKLHALNLESLRFRGKKARGAAPRPRLGQAPPNPHN